MRPERPQPSRYSVSSLGKAAKPNLEPRPRSRRGLSERRRRLGGERPFFDVPAGGWRGFGGPPRQGRWHQIGDRTRRPGNVGIGSLRGRLCALLSRLSSPPRLPRSIKRHLADFPHPLLGGTGDHQRLVDPRLELADGRYDTLGDDPVLRVVAFRTLDSGEFRPEGGGKRALSLDLPAAFPRHDP
jgi:hypothetical protein